ncbi:MAG TPA: hypothetical protein GX504_01810 [Clostridia bacterium]|nr:hypothetical protein [Clostridia bacterium]
MWKQKLGNSVAAAITAMFVLVAVAIVAASVFGSIFLFAQAAWAAAPSNDYCLSCHGNEEMKINFEGKEVSLFVNKETYESSVHGTLRCTSCHAGTETFPHQTQYSANFRQEMMESCKSCHNNIVQQFKNSTHGQFTGLVSCQSCHGEAHAVLPAENRASMHNRFNVVETCGTCHSGMVLESYQRSFHGIALSYEYENVPNCADCHTAHNILPSDNPNSSISPANIGSTCEPCHKGMINAGANLLNGKTHVVPEDKENAFPLWVTWKIFLGLILFDVVMNGTIPTFELIRHLRNLRRKEAIVNSGVKKNI